jgi:WD40 repeat protein
MRTCTFLTAGLLLLTAVPKARSQPAVIPPGDKNPVLRLQAGGPTSFINSLAFSPDGRTLYSAGWDKVVRVWRLDAPGLTWEEAPPYRVPLGPGADGKINGIALSADGTWLAAAGSGAIRNRAGFRDLGIIIDSVGMSEEMRKDQGNIYVFDVNTRAVKVLRGHRGPVFALTFAPPRPGAAKDEAPPLISAAREGSGTKADPYVGAVRVWNVAKGTAVLWPGALPDLGRAMGRPGLATWRPPGQADRLHVAVAWEDGTFRVWDVARGKDGLSKQQDAKLNSVVAALPGGQRLFTGGQHSPKGYLQVWQQAAGGEFRKDPTLIPTDLPESTGYVPMALTLFSSRPAGPLDHAAVAVHEVTKNAQGQLKKHICLDLVDIDPTSGQFGQRKASVFMWKYYGSMPTLAAAPGGRYLAMVDTEGEGVQGHGIYIYDIAELLAKKEQAQPWLQRGVGQSFRYASFVKSKNRLGLLLNVKPKEPGTPARAETAKGDLFFDFTKPGFTGSDDWKIDVPDLAGWQVKHHVGKDEQYLEVTTGGRAQKISLTMKQIVTDYALLPPVQPGSVSLVAVALHERGEPLLLLYNAANGKLLRHFTGHDDFIRSLAFSSDGKRLVSAGEDQTVCVWRLTDLKEILGKKGRLPGLAVTDNKAGAKGVIVGKLGDGNPAAEKLAVGDVIEAVDAVKDGKVTALTLPSAAFFYNQVWDRKPGDNITLHVTGKGKVVLPVDQAVDERRPLLTLFFTRANAAGAREWIGWSPQGPYDTSGPKGESRLGWHINTGKADAPTSFAKADQYRKEYYKAGLLKFLVARASLAPALEDFKKAEEAKLPPDPRVLVQVGNELLEARDTNKQGVIPVQTATPELHVQVEDFPADKIAAVEWEIDGQGLRKFDPPVGSDWTANLAPLQPGEHKIRIKVHTPGGRTPDTIKGPLTMLYQLPRPEVESAMLPNQTVKRAEFDIVAKVSQEVPDQAVDITVLLNGKVVANPAGPDIRESVKLKNGRNVVSIVAVNRKALAGHQERETARLDLAVWFAPTKPQIALADIVPLVGGKTPGQPLVANPEQPVFLTVPKFRVRGTITAQEPLTKATLAGKDLTGFQPGKKEQPFDQEVTVTKAGLQTFTFAVATENTKESLDLNVEYQPQLPRLVYIPSPEGRVYYDEGKGAPEVTLRYKLSPPQDPPPFDPALEVAVLINGKKPAPAPVVERKDKELTVKFTPQDRDSQVRVQLSAAGARMETSDTHVQYLQVPYGLQFVKPVAESRAPMVELTARVQSPLELLPDNVVATVDDKTIPEVVVEKEAGRGWLIRLKNVSLNGTKDSKSVVRLQVGNADGPSHAPQEWSVTYLGPEPRRPDVALLLNPNGVNVRDPDLIVPFRVTSESKLTYLALVNDDALPAQELDVSKLPDGPVDLKIALRLVPRGLRKKLDLATLKPNAEGVLEGEADLALVPKTNTLYVRAQNGAGLKSSQEVVVSFTPPAVRVMLDKLEPFDGGKAVPITVRADGPQTLVTTKAAEGRLVLHGRVVWSQGEDERLKKVERVFVRVNSVLQVDPVRLEAPAPGKPRERAFQVKVFLSQAKDNRLEVEVPGLPVQESDQLVYLMSCTRPVAEKKMLHLLLIGIGERNSDAFKRLVLGKLGATSIASQEFKEKGYDDGFVYGPLMDNVRPVEREDVFRQFLTMKKRMDAIARREFYTHHVLVYYKGAEVESDAGKILRLSEAELDKALKFYRLPLGNLEKQLTEGLGRGAQVLLLDVRRESPRTKVETAAARLGDAKVARMSYAVYGTDKAAKTTLISALGESLRKASMLGQVDRSIRQALGPTFYSSIIPASMEELNIGPAEKR